ncbi:MAG: phosphomannomutase/phosphoglucomutase, partial [Planctomycetota bacterium]
VGCDLATAWLAPGFLTNGGGVVYDLRSSKILPETIKNSGGEPYLSRVGHVFMKSKMKETGSSFGGELSGHFYFKDNWCADSGAIAFAAFCARMVADAKPLSECIGPLRRYCQSGEINFEVDDKAAAMDRLVAASPDAEVLHVDGVTVDHGSWWCNVRPSNTEPLLRLNLEAATLKEVDQRVAEISTVLGGTRVDH